MLFYLFTYLSQYTILDSMGYSVLANKEIKDNHRSQSV